MPFNNIDSTAAQISRMTPQQRQQFAQMHKTDPIMMSLVSFVQNQDEAFRAAQMAKMTGQEKPKVVDQVIASINPPPQTMPQGMPPQAAQQLPENTGIAALPAPNMQNMAEGGITEQDPEAGFVGNEGVTRLDDGRLAQEYQRARQSGNSSRAEAIKNELDYRASRFKKYMADGGITGFQNNPFVPQVDQGGMNYGDADYSMPTVRMANGTPPVMFSSELGYVPESTAEDDSFARQQRQEEELWKFEQKKGKRPESLQAEPSAAPQQKAEVTRTLPAASRPSSTKDYLVPRQAQGPEAVYKRMSSEPTVDPYAAARQEISDFATSAAEKRREQLAKDIAERGEAFKGAEERVSKREQGLSKMEDRETGLALLAAGAAMMSTPGGFSRAFGKGVQVGASQYGEGMAKVESAKQKIDDARDKIEEYRRTEKMMTAKERAEAEKDFTQTTISAKNAMLAGLEQAGAKKESVAQLFTKIAADQQAAQIKAAADAANARASGMPGLAREIAAASPEQAKRLLEASAKIQGQESKAQTAHEKLMANDKVYNNMFMQFAFETDPKKQSAIESQISNYLATKNRVESQMSGKNPQNAFPGFKVISP